MPERLAEWKTHMQACAAGIGPPQGTRSGSSAPRAAPASGRRGLGGAGAPAGRTGRRSGRGTCTSPPGSSWAARRPAPCWPRCRRPRSRPARARARSGRPPSRPPRPARAGCPSPGRAARPPPVRPRPASGPATRGAPATRALTAADRGLGGTLAAGAGPCNTKCEPKATCVLASDESGRRALGAAGRACSRYSALSMSSGRSG